MASTHAGTAVAPAEHHGVAAGALNSSAPRGTAIGLALLAPFAAHHRLGFLGAGVSRWPARPPGSSSPAGPTRSP